ncbi:tetraspanin-7-like [Trichogramma pretiosum]|uniref:Tetraspanin n=1 Tax=Trichogramma kaykai TaxID=54128 RepID=A0ABD2XD09_9HYME|nr:tetraspanin-7-like [Trichogramma pretiosum]
MAKQLQSVAAVACMTTFLMLFNIAFFGSGLFLHLGGIYMKLWLQDYFNVGMDGHGGYVFIAIASLGGLVALAALFACCCAARQHPALLYLYGAFLAVIALLELGAAASVYTYRTTVIEGFDRALNDSLLAYGVDKTKSFHLDIMQSTFHCCGNRAYTDYLNMQPTKMVPSSCCSVQEGECDTTDTEDIYTEGCYNRVLNFIRSNVGLVAGCTLGVAAAPLIGVLLSCCLASYINKIHYEQIS